jgi:hypothetical protein
VVEEQGSGSGPERPVMNSTALSELPGGSTLMAVCFDTKVSQKQIYCLTSVLSHSPRTRTPERNRSATTDPNQQSEFRVYSSLQQQTD